ncbi:MAG: dTMP kinase [Gemmatimonadales bacterium]|nr:dTMP kinase [Gemmatimonadales bacterium]
MAGRFLVLEGPEGAGKSTLAASLAARLLAAGVTVVPVREPGGTPTAEAARDALLHAEGDLPPEAELFLILAARADLVRRVIRPALAAGHLVLADRYDLSTLAYQVAGRGLDAGQVAAANALATGGLAPDLVLVLDVPPGVGAARQVAAGKQRDRLDRESDDFHARVAKAYLAARGTTVQHLDGTRSPAEVLEQAWNLLRPWLPGVPSGPAPE